MRCSEIHKRLVDGVGRCSVPMWDGYGMPAGFCDKPAFGNPGAHVTRYTPGLACPGHGGPKHPVVDIVFDGPPSHESGRFVEVEDATGRSISVGKWVKRSDGFWALRITREAPDEA